MKICFIANLIAAVANLAACVVLGFSGNLIASVLYFVACVVFLFCAKINLKALRHGQ